MSKYNIEEREKVYKQLENDEISIGMGIKMLRKLVNQSQVQYAKIIGIDVRVLSQFENGKGNLRQHTIEKIIEPFGLIIAVHRKKNY